VKALLAASFQIHYYDAIIAWNAAFATLRTVELQLESIDFHKASIKNFAKIEEERYNYWIWRRENLYLSGATGDHSSWELLSISTYDNIPEYIELLAEAEGRAKAAIDRVVFKNKSIQWLLRIFFLGWLWMR